MLAGVPGKLKTLLDRLTAARAANLDKLDANVSTRAPAATALSNAVWTDARAAKLDANVLTNGVIKSIQRGTHAGASGDITVAISSINPDKSIVILNSSAGSLSGASLNTPMLKSISSTSFVVSASGAGGGGGIAFSWQLIEFY